MDPPDSFSVNPPDNTMHNTISEAPSMKPYGSSILKVKPDVDVQPSQLSLLAIEEARRYQQVEKKYKARKAKAAAEGNLDTTQSITVASGKSSEVSGAKKRTTSPPASSELGEWEFTAPPKPEGCCVIS